MFRSIIPVIVKKSTQLIIASGSSLAMKTVHFRNHKIYRDMRKQLVNFDNYIYFRRKHYIKSYSFRIISGFLCGSGLLVAADVGLNFDLALKFSTKACMKNNLKAIVMALMMSDCLTPEEVELMTTIVEMLPLCEKNSFQREKWCEGEMLKFMQCAEKFGSIRCEQCSIYRTFLKSCLQARTNCQQVRFSTIVSTTQQCLQDDESTIATEKTTQTETECTCAPFFGEVSEIEADEKLEEEEEDEECCCTCSCLSSSNEETKSDDQDQSLKFLL